MTKAAVRKRFLEARLSLDNLEIHKKSKKLFKNFLQVDELASKKNVLLYFPIKNEVETQNFFAFYLKLGANIFLPLFLRVFHGPGVPARLFFLLATL